MNYWLVFILLGPLTLGIGYLVWYYKLSARMGAELQRRGLGYSFGASTFWLWTIAGALIIVGPFIYIHNLVTACNKLSENYNQNG